MGGDQDNQAKEANTDEDNIQLKKTIGYLEGVSFIVGTIIL